MGYNGSEPRARELKRRRVPVIPIHIADHNAYHVGQLILLRRLLGAWPA
jgi:hypothetical protein